MSIGRRGFFAAAAISTVVGSPMGRKVVTDMPLKTEWVSGNGRVQKDLSQDSRLFVDPAANRFGSIDVKHGDQIGLHLDEVVDLLVRSGVVKRV